MSTSTSRTDIDAPLNFRMPEGASLRVYGVALEFITRDDELYEVRVTVEVPPEVYLSFAVRGIFHLAPDNRGQGAESFAPETTVRVEARLNPELYSEVELAGGTPEALAEAMHAASSAHRWSPLLETESWFALHVTTLVEQQIDSAGELRMGYSTIFAGQEPGQPSGPGLLRLPLIGAVIETLGQRNIEWAETGDDEVIEAEIAGESGTWTCFFVAREEAQRVSVYSQVPWYAPEHIRGAMAELLTRINYGLSIGNFEMDYSDGEIRFKTSIDLSGSGEALNLVDSLLDPNFGAMDTYLPALEAVLDGRQSPAEALAAVENR